MLVTPSKGTVGKYYHKWVGGNFRLDTMQAAALLIKLPLLDGWHEGRRQNAAFYDAAFADVAEVVTPTNRDYNEVIYNQYIVRVPNRDACVEHLKAQGVGCEIYYPVTMHQQECFAPLGYKAGDFPESEKAATETMALPIYPELEETQLQEVVDTLKAFV